MPQRRLFDDGLDPAPDDPSPPVDTPRAVVDAHAHGEIETDVDGYSLFFPERRGGLSASDLRALADEIDRRDAPWDAVVRADPAINATPSPLPQPAAPPSRLTGGPSGQVGDPTGRPSPIHPELVEALRDQGLTVEVTEAPRLTGGPSGQVGDPTGRPSTPQYRVTIGFHGDCTTQTYREDSTFGILIAAAYGCRAVLYRHSRLT